MVMVVYYGYGYRYGKCYQCLAQLMRVAADSRPGMNAWLVLCNTVRP